MLIDGWCNYLTRCKMKFEVGVKEIHFAYFVVNAGSKEEAVKKLNDGLCEEDESKGIMLTGFEYNHTLDPDEWTVNELEE